MKSNFEIQLASIIRSAAKYFLLLIWSIVVLYLLIENYQDERSRFDSFILQSPYTLIWLILLGLILIAWKWDLFGGVTIVLFGIAMFYYFNFRSIDLFTIESLLAIAIVILGLLILLAWYMLLE
jgi:hypothetical protein